MEYLHSHGIRHCDLNSKNLLVNYAYSVKVADFGLSQDAEDDASGALVGKHFGYFPLCCGRLDRHAFLIALFLIAVLCAGCVRR